MADECVVTSANSLPALVQAVTERGACLVNNATLRAEYEPYLAMAQEFHLIRWRQSMDIRLGDPLPTLQGHGGRPLILRADPGVQVRILGGETSFVSVGGDGGLVVIDRLTFGGFHGTALKIVSDRNTVWRSRIIESGTAQAPALLITGRQNRVVEVEVTQNMGIGIFVREDEAAALCAIPPFPSGEKTRIERGRVARNGGDGVVIAAHRALLIANQIHENGGHGVRVETDSPASRCLEGRGEGVPDVAWHTARIEQSRFWENGGEAIFVSRHPLVAPIDLVVVSPPVGAEIVLVGNISRLPGADYPWRDGRLNFAALRVEIFLADGSAGGEGRQYLLTTDAIDPASRQFVVHLPTPLVVEGEEIATPIFTATVVDTENGNTSPFARALDWQASLDWDQDGISNAEEDLNHDGAVDLEESNPRLADSDGDLLTDGEERLLIGRLAQRGSSALSLSDPKRLDPRNPDSDGDCLVDGLEIGIGEAEATAWQPAAGSVLERPRIRLTPACEAALRKRSVVSLANAIPWDPARPATVDNLGAMFDADPRTRTDPTSHDTDRDAVSDGTEDWNLDGKRSATMDTSDAMTAVRAAALLTLPAKGADAVAWIETDPTLADSDGDGFQDGEEGDRNGDGQLDATETDPLRNDTDGDGVDDATEVRKFGSTPNECDSDGDGLADGLEAGVMNPRAPTPQCLGLQTAGSNFASLGALQILNADSDNDGLPDGEEDRNHNGWLDPQETDPTTPDTDGDGLSDYVEVTGDLDRDGIADIDLTRLKNGAHCAPPAAMNDLDCDGSPNANDDDADNDGCPDQAEGIDPHGDPNGIPAAFNAKITVCDAHPTGGGGGAAPPAPSGSPTPTTAEVESAYFASQIKGGGSCQLVVGNPPNGWNVSWNIGVLVVLLGCLLCRRRGHGEDRLVRRRG